MTADLKELFSSFSIPGSIQGISQIKRGHINDTYLSVWRGQRGERRYVHQRVNGSIFKDPQGLMRNVERVLSHVRRKVSVERLHSEETALELVPSKEGRPWVEDREGSIWRTYLFIEDSSSYDVCTGTEIAFEAARAFGRFQSYLLDLPYSDLVATIPGFIDSAKRFAALKNEVARDVHGRVAEAERELAFALGREEAGTLIMSALTSTLVPWRSTHNDLKLNNVLFSAKTGRFMCVVDLDTCMPGSVLFDFGDLARSTAVGCGEDEQDFSKVQVNLPLFEALLNGYLADLGGSLTEAELEFLPTAPKVVALTLGVRFLTDFIGGDTYFKVSHPRHNLERARTQFKIVERMEEASELMKGAAKRAAASALRVPRSGKSELVRATGG